jgi:hypothetical protein
VNVRRSRRRAAPAAPSGGGGALHDLALRSMSQQAVRGAGPHKGVAPGRLFPAPQHGYESAASGAERDVRTF